jgi:N-acetylglucosamine kinase-like BadF-type ATPase
MRIAVAGGHTKSSAVAIDGSINTSFKVLGCSEIDRGLNLHLRDPREIGLRLKSLIDKLGEKVGCSGDLLSRCESGCIALPGAATQVDQKLAEAALARAGWCFVPVSILDDTWAGLIAGASSCRGICAFASTGASVFVGLGEFSLDRTHKLDGWGAFLGDRGSGFQLVTNTLRHIARTIDADRPLSLAKEVLAQLNISDISQLQEWFDQLVNESSTEWHLEVSKLARLIIAKADDEDNPDETARSLVRHVADNITETICVGIERFKPDTADLPVILQGSMFEHSKLYRGRVLQSVSTRVPNQTRISERRPLYGALVMLLCYPCAAPTDQMIEIVESRFEPIPAECAKFLYYWT